MRPRPPVLRRSAAIMATASLALAACGGTSATVLSTVSESAAAAASVAPSAEPPTTSFTFASVEPVVSREQTGIDEAFINPGAVFEHDGVFHMFANLFTGFPGVSQVPHLTSPDGVTWTLAEEEPVLVTDDIDFAATGAHVSAGFVADDGTWVLIFESLSSLEPWRLGRATAQAPEGPWTVDAEPILEPGEEGEADAGGLSWPSVVPTADGYAMYYTAKPTSAGDGVIAMATSPDGETWTKADAPVLEPALEWEEGSLDRPRVAVTPDGFAMVYSGRDLTNRGVAYSTDGVTWQRDGGAPVITQDDFPVDGRCWDATLLFRDGTLHYILEIGAGTATGGGTQLYLASAPLP